MKGYKAFRKGYKGYGDFQFEIGKSYHADGEIKICENGFHFCRNLIDVFGYYPFSEENTVLAEVEADGAIKQEGTKYCAENIKIVRSVEWEEVKELIKDGYHNSGDYNSGNFNSGDCNSGNCNSGDFNSGDYNSGDFNSGFFNSSSPTVRLFNRDSGMTFEEFFKLGIDFYDLNKSREIIEKLPNYNAEIFLEATGLDWTK